MTNHKYEPLLFGKVFVSTLQTQFIDFLCLILFLLGIIGNLSGLFIFSLSRRTWRISSRYAILAICSSITNLLCVIRYAAILHSTTRIILRQSIGESWWACKFYELSFSFRVMSSWIVLFWMFERSACVSRRLHISSKQWKSYKGQVIIPILLMMVILICVVGPPVYMFQPKITLKNERNSTIKYCELHRNASIQWQKYFHEYTFGINHSTVRCLFSELIPTGAIILLNLYLINHILRAYRCLSRLNSKQIQTTSWMNLILILHSLLFLSSLLSHILGHFSDMEAHETWWVLLSVLINSSLNFYIYCLSGKAFRNEIRRLILCF